MNGAERERLPHNRPPRPVPREHRGQAIALPDRVRRVAATGRRTDDDPPELVGEIHTLEGSDAELIELQQARVLREVIAWLARNTSPPQQERAA